MEVDGAATRQMRLVMGPHGILDAGVGIVRVVHGDVTVAVAQMRWGNGRGGRIVGAGSRRSGGRSVDRDSAMELVVFVCGGRRGLLRSIVSGHLAVAVMSPRSAWRSGVGIRLPLGIHGWRCFDGLRRQQRNNDSTSATLARGRGQREPEAGAGGVPAAAAAAASMSRELSPSLSSVGGREEYFGVGESRRAACGGGMDGREWGRRLTGWGRKASQRVWVERVSRSATYS